MARLKNFSFAAKAQTPGRRLEKSKSCDRQAVAYCQSSKGSSSMKRLDCSVSDVCFNTAHQVEVSWSCLYLTL